jgi:hypothetical protein
VYDSCTTNSLETTMNLKTIATVATAITLAASATAHAQTEGNDLHARGARTSLQDAVIHAWIAPSQDHTVRVEVGAAGNRQMATLEVFPRVQM